ncbi:MAG: phosphoribosylformylglycinamidine cyclo-ligase [Bacilli bacterium]
MAKAYKEAGVNIEAGYESVERMKKHVAGTMRKEVLGGLGGFGAMFDLSETGYQKPVLVSGTDGVGTKLMIAMDMDRHDTIGIDCVAMCANDIVVQGAEPLYFLDYIACGKQEPKRIEAIVKGIADGCIQANASLIGGETAEMPGMYDENEYDLAGFCVGVAEKDQLITGANIAAGDVLIGLASSGIHSNGYSLVRKIVKDNDLKLNKLYGELALPLGEELLRPTKIYVKPVLKAIKEVEVRGLSHVTGGGFIENLPRMLPEGLGVAIEKDSWPILPIFHFLKKYGALEWDEMYNIFNMGIGMVAVVPAADVDKAVALFAAEGEQAYVIGSVTATPGVTFVEGNTHA